MNLNAREIVNHFFSLNPPRITIRNIISSAAVQDVQASTSSERKQSIRLLNITVMFDGKTVEFEIPETATILRLKEIIFAKLGIAPFKQILCSKAQLPNLDKVCLSNLSLPDKIDINLEVHDEDSDPEKVKEPNKYIYLLKIFDETMNNLLELEYPGSTEIKQVKAAVETMTNILVSHQIWTGWPSACNDQTTLVRSGIPYPVHELKVKKSITPIDDNYVIIEDSDEEGEVDVNQDPLIPDNTEDEIVGSYSFKRQFAIRYGMNSANFFLGTLSDAINSAFQKPLRTRKILAMYFHYDRSPRTRTFCKQLFSHESVVQILGYNFILWGWDISTEANRNFMWNSIERNFSAPEADKLRNIPTDRLPVVVLALRHRTKNLIYAIMYCNITTNDFVHGLLETLEVWKRHLLKEVRVQELMTSRKRLRLEQDKAYEESLAADRAKDEAKRIKKKVEAEKRMREESELAESQAKKARLIATVASTLPSEPIELSRDEITVIRVKPPNGEYFQRRFSHDTKMQILFDFITAQGYPTEEYKLLSFWPRVDLTTMDSNQTLKDMGLCPQETVILEER